MSIKDAGDCLAAHFQSSLSELITAMEATESQFVRCMKPNNDKVNGEFDTNLVLRQLQTSGVIDAINARRHGYAIRFTHPDFFRRYANLMEEGDPVGPSSKFTRKLMERAGKSKANGVTDWQIGKTRVFIKPWILEPLDRAIETKYEEAALTIQSVVQCIFSWKKLKIELKHKKERRDREEQEIRRQKMLKAKKDQEEKERLKEEQQRIKREKQMIKNKFQKTSPVKVKVENVHSPTSSKDEEVTRNFFPSKNNDLNPLIKALMLRINELNDSQILSLLTYSYENEDTAISPEAMIKKISSVQQRQSCCANIQATLNDALTELKFNTQSKSTVVSMPSNSPTNGKQSPPSPPSVSRSGRADLESWNPAVEQSVSGIQPVKIQPINDGVERCHACGAQRWNGANFCIHCGSAFEDVAERISSDNSPEHQEKYETIFKHFDKDKDKYLNNEELLQFLDDCQKNDPSGKKKRFTEDDYEKFCDAVEADPR